MPRKNAVNPSTPKRGVNPSVKPEPKVVPDASAQKPKQPSAAAAST